MMRLGATALVLLALSSCTCLCGASSSSCGEREDEACGIDSSALLQTQRGKGKGEGLAQPPPFSVENLTIGQAGETVGLKVLKNPVTGESVDIAVTFGGKVDALRLRSPKSKKVREVLLSSGRNASKLLNMGWGVNEFLLPFANRIENGTYTDPATDKTYYMPRTDKEATGSNAIHGFLIGKPTTVVNEKADFHSASVTLAYDFNEKSNSESVTEGYPFPLSVQITYTLDEGGFYLTVDAKNEAEEGEPLPFYMGMHPYFEVTDVSKSKVLLDSCSSWNQIEVDENLIPTGMTKPFDGFNGSAIGGSKEKPTKWDNGFKAIATSADCGVLMTEVYDPSIGDSSFLWMNSPNFKWLQIFTGGTPDLGQVIAVEPMSGETDAFNNGQAVELFLQAGETWQGTYGFQLALPSSRALGESPSA